MILVASLLISSLLVSAQASSLPCFPSRVNVPAPTESDGTFHAGVLGWIGKGKNPVVTNAVNISVVQYNSSLFVPFGDGVGGDPPAQLPGDILKLADFHSPSPNDTQKTFAVCFDSFKMQF